MEGGRKGRREGRKELRTRGGEVEESSRETGQQDSSSNSSASVASPLRKVMTPTLIACLAVKAFIDRCLSLPPSLLLDFTSLFLPPPHPPYHHAGRPQEGDKHVPLPSLPRFFSKKGTQPFLPPSLPSFSTFLPVMYLEGRKQEREGRKDSDEWETVSAAFTLCLSASSFSHSHSLN